MGPRVAFGRGWRLAARRDAPGRAKTTSAATIMAAEFTDKRAAEASRPARQQSQEEFSWAGAEHVLAR